MLKVRQVKNGAELHDLECTDATRIGKYPETLVLNGLDEVGNKTILIFTALDDEKIDNLNECLECEEYYVEVYKVSKLAYEALAREHLNRIEFTDLYTHAVDELSKLKGDSEYTKTLNPNE